MYALSIKKDSFSFISFSNENNQILVNDYGSIKLKKDTFSKHHINQLHQRKNIKKSNIISKKCMIFLMTEDVVLNQLNYIKELSLNESIDWQNQLMFNGEKPFHLNDYHYKSSVDNNILSIYIDEKRQIKYLKDCKAAGMNLKVLSLSIFSAEYMAREIFGAKDQNNYMVWAIGNVFDEIIIYQHKEFKSLIKFKRNKDTIEPLGYLGSKNCYNECINKLKSIDIFKDLKNIDFVDKIYMYQKNQNTDMRKILKKNKDAVIILNPLLKARFLKKTKVDDIESSYLSEMGYVFKAINND